MPLATFGALIRALWALVVPALAVAIVSVLLKFINRPFRFRSGIVGYFVTFHFTHILIAP